MADIDYKIIFTNNDCYKANQKMTPRGIVVHSTGCNNPYLSRYVAPDNGIIGKNLYGNDWNRPGEDVCVHAFIGKDKNGAVKTVQTLPFDICCWGVGRGYNGSYNYDPAYIQFEMCEDDLSDNSYCKATYNKAVEFCAYLCKRYNIPINNIVSHYEAHLQGYGSDHIDPTNWWKYHNLTMNMFRADVKKKIGGSSGTRITEIATLKFNYLAYKGYVNVPAQVKMLQRLLRDIQYKGKDGKELTINSKFDANTDYAVRQFQKKNGLTVDGIVGAATWKKLTGAK